MVTRVGIVGSGYMAREYLKAANAVIELEVAAIWSRNSKTAELLAHQYHIGLVVHDIAGLKSLNLDFIIICVPELATESIVISCLDLGIPLLVEKPVGINLDSALRIEQSAKFAGVSVYAALNRRFYDSTLSVMEEVKQTVGPRFLQVTDQENILAALAAGQPEMVVDNWMFANSIHIIDYISFICRGSPIDITRTRVNLHEGTHVMIANIPFSSGDFATYTCYWNTPASWSVEITSDQQIWKLSPLEKAMKRGLEDTKFVDFELEKNETEYKPGLVNMLSEIVSHSLKRTCNLTTISEANRTMKLIELIYSNDR